MGNDVFYKIKVEPNKKSDFNNSHDSARSMSDDMWRAYFLLNTDGSRCFLELDRSGLLRYDLVGMVSDWQIKDRLMGELQKLNVGTWCSPELA